MYRVRNWREYNAALVKRGSLTVWLDEASLSDWMEPHRSGRRGASRTYSQAAIQAILLLKAVYHLPLRGGKGAYGYLAHATAEGDLLREIASRAADGYLRLCCAVPEDAIAQNGLAIYGAECGRYPICPTILIEW